MDENQFDSGELEKCLEQMFLDPLTSLLDYTQFRVDVFETGEEIIVEALFQDSHFQEIILARKDECLEIEIVLDDQSKRKRDISFPFSLQFIPFETFWDDRRLEVRMKKKIESSPQPTMYRIQSS
ncbi:hypothetical protein [Falsibacillus albus]|uniref:Hsp20/alpha crystallin family protein n=1 Tax=Falsibacillus albus TaxID=2478915 RepID=A0A3L7JZI3_9BACI|nr:hypothetical protein [Falsibacillus albus]RLQ96173.1 hypothetical protein D9X91_07735 [Falsibacillus albus]